MKIKLNEKDKRVIKDGAVFAVGGIDSFITGAGCGVVGIAAFGLSKKAVGFASALALVISIFRANGDYYDTLICDTGNACDWVFNKLEKSNQKVVEFEKWD